MKRKISLILILMLVLAAICSCGTPAESTTATSDTTVPAPVIPTGYTEYSNGDISFAYPSDWVKTDGSVVILTNKSGVGNNITVSYEAKTNMYDSFTVADFNSMVKPAYESMGMTISNLKIEHKEVGGEKVNVISFRNTVSGQSMTQTQYIFNAGSRTYIVTVTESTPDSNLVKNVFDTIKVLK